MAIDRKRYPKDWHHIALSIKQRRVGAVSIARDYACDGREKPRSLTRSKWTYATLSVHHSNFTPEDNATENLIALCTPCHNRSAWPH